MDRCYLTHQSETLIIYAVSSDTRATLTTVRSMYLLSKRTALYAQVRYLSNSAEVAYTVSAGGGGTTPHQGASQLGAMIGMRQYF
jgi:predicted porin